VNTDHLQAARAGDPEALLDLFNQQRSNLYRFIYRMLAQPDAVDDVLQEVWVRGQSGIAAFRGDEAGLKSWWFSITSNLCLNWLNQRKRWRAHAQLSGEHELDNDPEQVEQLAATMSDPSFRYEAVEHIAFCLSCIGRCLEPSLQAAVFLREIFEFNNDEAARILGLSEPVFRHKLASARSQMAGTFDGLCQLINKTGRCYQCATLREFAPENHRGGLLVQIEPAKQSSGAELAEALLDTRFGIARTANLEDGGTAAVHRLFFSLIGHREQSSQD
jgi:RNA polymerase sigma factor (sigma-70 family)